MVVFNELNFLHDIFSLVFYDYFCGISVTSVTYWSSVVFSFQVCVICGYGGGAMTRALNAQKILRSSLKGLRVTTWSDKNVKHNSFYASKSRSLGSIPGVDKQQSIGSAHEDTTVRCSWTANHNSSLLGPKTMQWIHVVCGLWTPGAKCPNSTTMNAFDISGALPGKINNVSSLHAYSYDDFFDNHSLHAN
jgi:hypothetical protein